MPSSSRAIIAAAGSLKTQLIIDEAVTNADKRILITTYTNENLRQIRTRLAARNGGVIPGNIVTTGWLTFVMNQCARPYQSAVLRDIHYMDALDFDGQAHRGVPIAEPHQYFFDRSRNLYRRTASHFAVLANQYSDGLVVDRLGDMFDHIYIDEIQDLAGYDLDLLEALLASTIQITAVGDPRQAILTTTNSTRNRNQKGANILGWFQKQEKKGACVVEERTYSTRCNQAICDFADKLFPEYPPTKSRNAEITGHDGIFKIPRREVFAYVEKHQPTVLRHQIRSDTMKLPAINFGVAKGSTYDRVLIFPTKPILDYLASGDPNRAGDKSRLYIAATRARFSVAFAMPD